MRRRIFLISIASLLFGLFSQASAQEGEPLRVMMTVGGVSYHTEIVRQLRRNENIELVVRDFDDDPAIFTQQSLAGFDAVLMYHRDNVADRQEREALLEFLDNGGGVVVLHHSIANYPDWDDWWRNHVGGLYVFSGDGKLPPSRYFAGFEGVAVKAGPHPVTRRFNRAWRYMDESYEGLWISKDVTPLLRTTAFGSDELLAWIGPSDSRRVAYIQPGHDARIMREPVYLNLLEDSLVWAAGK